MSTELVHLRRDPDDFEGSVLERALRRDVDGEVRFDRGTRALYATDASNYRHPPIGVVVPRTLEAAIAAMAICHEHDVPVLPRGGGTSLAGQCCNRAVVIDCSRHLNEVTVDPTTKLAHVQPGVVLDELNHAAAPHGLVFGPDPATHDRCTLGGMLGNNSCGVHSLLSEFYGPGARTSDHVRSLEVLTYDGLRLELGPTDDRALHAMEAKGGRIAEIYAGLERIRRRYGEEIARGFPNIPRRVSGYNLPELLDEHGFHVARALVGSEATLAFILGATVELVPKRPQRALAIVGFDDIYSAADAIPAARAHRPVACEGVDAGLMAHVKKLHKHTDVIGLLPQGRAWLLIEHGADTLAEAKRDAERTARDLGSPRRAAVYADPHQEALLWDLREAALGVTAYAPGERDTYEGWEDAAVPPTQVGAYLREFHRLLGDYGLSGALYGHFGDGCVHTRINFGLRSDAGLDAYRRFTADAAKIVVAHGGSLSGEHGDGQSRGELLDFMYGPDLVEAFREVKGIWDPKNRMNPGKIVMPHGRTEDVRLFDYHPRLDDVRLSTEHDGKDFGHAAMRCVGIGKCRKKEEGTMCPSYMVTLDERHSTRGRAHLLFEMMRGDLLTQGWRSDAAREALDLCLACKACKAECPVNVDMATYKSEFMSHYYEGRMRPRDAYLFGRIHRWAGLASSMPRLANLVSSTPGLSRLMKWTAGIASEREAPRFAHQSFRRSFRPRAPTGAVRGRVVLWPDTFNDAFHPEILHAAAEVLTRAGYAVDIPKKRLCCGRPMIEYGWIDEVRALWEDTFVTLHEEVAAGVPVIGVEPSCTVSFRDELLSLFPQDERARRLSKHTFSLAEFLAADQAYAPPVAHGHVVYHAHCQQRAVLSKDTEVHLLESSGLSVEALDSGCCGMAGAFGFRTQSYPLSRALAERVLLPRVREADADTMIVTDGFSCREQLRQLAGIRALHTAEVLEHAGAPRIFSRPESERPPAMPDESRHERPLIR